MLLVSITIIQLCSGQCSPWDNTEVLVSNDGLSALFNANPMTLTNLQGKIELFRPIFEEICVYEVQAPEGYCVDYNIPSLLFISSPFYPINSTITLSIIDGSGVFGGNYLATFNDFFTTSAPVDPDVVFYSKTNRLGVVISAGSLVGDLPPNVIDLSFFSCYKVRKCTASPALANEICLVVP